MKVKYIGNTFGALSLTDGRIYEVTEVDKNTGMLRIIDDDAANDFNFDDDPDWVQGYLYSPACPRPLSSSESYGRFEIIEDDENDSLAKALEQRQ